MKKLLIVLMFVTLATDAFAYYNSSTGRWLSRDPIEEDGGANLYAMVENDPINGTDFLGKWRVDLHEGQTIIWANEAGIRLHYSMIIGSADIGVDHPLSGHSPLPNSLGGEQSRHLYYDRGGDSRDVWYRDEFAAAVEHLKAVECAEAAMAFGRGLHSRQDRSAHRPWPGGGDWPPFIAHPGWWDAWTDDGYSKEYFSDEMWGRIGARPNMQPDYADWMNTPEQRASQEAARQQVRVDSHDAIEEFVEAVKNSCCGEEILLNP